MLQAVKEHAFVPAHQLEGGSLMHGTTASKAQLIQLNVLNTIALWQAAHGNALHLAAVSMIAGKQQQVDVPVNMHTMAVASRKAMTAASETALFNAYKQSNEHLGLTCHSVYN